jgi:hypothetical protein
MNQTRKNGGFEPRKPLPGFCEMAVQTALLVIGVLVIVVAGLVAWLDVTPK